MSQHSQGKTQYAEFLASDYWREVSIAVKSRAGNKCQVCNSPNELQAHHRTYEHHGNEMNHLDDLVCLCRTCHAGFHVMKNSGVRELRGDEKIELKRHRTAGTIESSESVLITARLSKKLELKKELWHWMHENGLEPRASGWRKRVVGRLLPIRCIAATAIHHFISSDPHSYETGASDRYERAKADEEQRLRSQWRKCQKRSCT